MEKSNGDTNKGKDGVEIMCFELIENWNVTPMEYVGHQI